MTSWRYVLQIHPAAELFPLMIPGELAVLGADIKTNGLTSPIVLWTDGKSPEQLLDGRNRLDAIEKATGSPAEIGAPSIMAGKDFLAINKVIVLDKSVDPYAYVISANIHRRHLTPEQKRELIAKLIKADPSKSDRQIAETVKASPTTVGTVRAEMESTVQIGQLPKRVGKDGKSRAQPNRARAPIHRAMRLGEDTIAKIKGTALDTARALIFLNRGAPEGGHTPEVKKLVAAAAAGKDVSAVAYTKSGAAFRREDIGPDSTTEIARKDAEIAELRNAKRMLEIKIAGLESEIEELRAEHGHEVVRLRAITTKYFGKLADELAPHLKSLAEQGRMSLATMAPTAVAVAAEKLRRVLIKHGIIDDDIPGFLDRTKEAV
jgi:hypothetical protein